MTSITSLGKSGSKIIQSRLLIKDCEYVHFWTEFHKAGHSARLFQMKKFGIEESCLISHAWLTNILQNDSRIPLLTSIIFEAKFQVGQSFFMFFAFGVNSRLFAWIQLSIADAAVMLQVWHRPVNNQFHV